MENNSKITISISLRGILLFFLMFPVLCSVTSQVTLLWMTLPLFTAQVIAVGLMWCSTASVVFWYQRLNKVKRNKRKYFLTICWICTSCYGVAVFLAALLMISFPQYLF